VAAFSSLSLFICLFFRVAPSSIDPGAAVKEKKEKKCYRIRHCLTVDEFKGEEESTKQ